MGAPNWQKGQGDMKHARPRFLACLLALATIFGARGAQAALSLEQEVQAGRGFVNAFIEQYGESEEQGYRELAESVLQALARASGERPELQWRVVVLRHNPNNPVSCNAAAFPGGYIVTDDAFLRTIEQGAGGDAKRMEAMLAGVLAHEMAHIVRRDTDALVPVFFAGKASDAPKLLFTLKSREGAPKESATETRVKENECDRHGAFYLLRAGYRVDDMIDVFRHLADEEVDEVLFSSELDHARATERVGNLLEVQNQVTEDERLYDEAVNILRLGLDEEMLRVAERNLETVSVRFPKVLPVRHARAVLAHRRFLAKTPPERLELKPSFTFYRFRASRSLMMDDHLRQAIAEYEAILQDYESQGYRGLGPTVAGYALALLHAGNAEKALSWAKKAVELAPEEWNGYNVLGMASYRKGLKTEAAAHLRKAVALAVPEGPRALVERALLTPAMEESAVLRYIDSQPPVEFGPALFNLGVVLKAAGDKSGAAHAFQGYLATDSRSDWGRLARKHLDEMKIVHLPTAAPPVAGVTVGLSDVELRKKLGNPEGITSPRPGVQVWRYKSKGFSIFLDEENRVRAGVLYPPYAGQLGPGVTLGAKPEAVEKVWGQATATAAVSTRQAWAYPEHGLTFLMTGGKVSKVVWAPAPLPGGGTLSATIQVRVGDTAEEVEKALGTPDAGKGEEATGGVWVYDRRGVRVRFDRNAKAALVTITRPSDAQVGGIKLGDAAAAIRQRVGPGFVTTDVESAETYSFPNLGVAYVVRNAEVALIPLFQRES